MFNKLSIIFKPDSTSFIYDKEKEIVITSVKKVLKQKETLMNVFDIDGNFISKNEFEYNLISYAVTYGAKFSPTMYGKIESVDINKTKITLTPQNTWTIYILWLVTFSAAIVCLIKLFYHFEIKGVLFLLGFLFLGPVILKTIVEAGISALNLRYKMYIDKEIRAN